MKREVCGILNLYQEYELTQQTLNSSCTGRRQTVSKELQTLDFMGSSLKVSVFK